MHPPVDEVSRALHVSETVRSTVSTATFFPFLRNRHRNRYRRFSIVLEQVLAIILGQAPQGLKPKIDRFFLMARPKPCPFKTLLKHALVVLLLASASFAQQQQFDPSLFQSLHWRGIGPFRGGRTKAAAGVPSQRNVFYIGVV